LKPGLDQAVRLEKPGTGLKSGFLNVENQVYMSSKRTGRTGVQPKKPNKL